MSVGSNNSSCDNGELFGGVISKEKFSSIMRSSEAWFSNMLTLLSLILLQSIVLPLAFWYALYKGVKVLWRTNFAHFLKVERNQMDTSVA